MTVKIFKCFIASPSDTSIERDICDEIFDEINHNLGKKFNFRLESLRWEYDVIPDLGEDSQNVIDKQIGDKYSIFIGILNKKFGTPTKNAGSGTEQEFNNAYNRYVKSGKTEPKIFMYFNSEPIDAYKIDIVQFAKVKEFRENFATLGGLYSSYDGCADFRNKVKSHIEKYILDNLPSQEVVIHNDYSFIINYNETKFKESLNGFCNQPNVWLDPILSNTNNINTNPDENYKNRIDITDVISNPKSLIIKSPPEFGLTTLARYIILQASKSNKFWIYIDNKDTKPHKIIKEIDNQIQLFSKEREDVECIVLDSWNLEEVGSLKKLKILEDEFKTIPIIVMQTIDDCNFESEKDKNVNINREFKVLHLLALPKHQLRKVVEEYNKLTPIGDCDVVLNKVIDDLDNLNMHRTIKNCLTILKVSEKYFDESPVNRTKTLELVLFILFNFDFAQSYSSKKPDTKDCEFVLGRFCELMIRNNNYTFSKDYFIKTLNSFCDENLIDLDVNIVFDVLLINNIILKRSDNYNFRSSFWVFYFAAKRMHIDVDFSEYVFTNKLYSSFPELIEFYTGIDRNRKDALLILNKDLTETAGLVENKIGFNKEMNPYRHIKWQPKEEQITKMQTEIGENVINSRLPDVVKDQYCDKTYNQTKPYNQSIQTIFEEYSVLALMQKLKATSRALRNSDYIDTNLKKVIIDEILHGWDIITKVLLALSPSLAVKGHAIYDGAGFVLDDSFKGTPEERLNEILQVIPSNIVNFFKDDIYSNKLGPLLIDRFNSHSNQVVKHEIALLIASERSNKWNECIEKYLCALPKDSFYLFDMIINLQKHYRFSYSDPNELTKIGYLIKMGIAKHEFGIARPSLGQINKIPNMTLPKREEILDK